jgi:hypothetical protein
MANKIETYQDLISYKKVLKQEVLLLEKEIKDSKVVQFSNFLINKSKLKTPNFKSFHIPHINDFMSNPLGNLVSTFLLSNKKIRKYFIGFAIVRETVPFVLSEIKKIVNDKK